MENKQVKIIGLKINHSFGILEACELKFDQQKKLIPIKGEVGSGKSSLQTAVKIGTQGSKTLVDANLYGKIDTEVQLLDGDTPVFVGCRNKKDDDKLIYTLYTKDSEGNITKNPVIDGVKATPAKYLKLLQTELTWNLDKLLSENPTDQKKILLKLYQSELKNVGVIFDKSNPDYKNSILFKLEKAEEKRTQLDAIRKQKGGIADDLKQHGFDVYRPETLPEFQDTSEIKNQIKNLENKILIGKNNLDQQKKSKLLEIKEAAGNITNKAIQYNQKLKDEYNELLKEAEKQEEKLNKSNQQREQDKKEVINLHEHLKNYGYKGNEVKEFIDSLPDPDEREIEYPEEPDYIDFKDGKVVIHAQNKNNLPYIDDLKELREQYRDVSSKDFTFDDTEIKAEIDVLKNQLEETDQMNVYCNAIESFFAWQEADHNVKDLQKQYEKLLNKINTGVPGLNIVSENEQLFLMYNGQHAPDFFNNPGKEMRKLSSYSSTQKPIIAMLLQKSLLDKKPKSMRYIYIDDIPTDRKTIQMLENTAAKLNLNILVSITGDYERTQLKTGEFLIENGHVFFKK